MSQLQSFNFSAPHQNLWSTQQPGSFYENVNTNGQSFSFQAADLPKRKLEPLFSPLKDLKLDKLQQNTPTGNGYSQNFSNPQDFQSEMRLSTFGTTSDSSLRQVPNVINTSQTRQLNPFLTSNLQSGQNGRYFDYSPNTRQNTLVDAESANNSASKQSQGAGRSHQQFAYHERSMNNQQSQLNKLNESPFQSMVISKSNIGSSSQQTHERVIPQTKSSTSSSRQDFHSPQQSSSKQSHQYLPNLLTDSKKEYQPSYLSDTIQQKVSQIVNNNHNHSQIGSRKFSQLETQSEKSHSSKSKGSYADEAYRKWQPLFESARIDQTNQNYSQPYKLKQSTEPSFGSPSRSYSNSYQNHSDQRKFSSQKSNQLSPSSDYAYSDTQNIINKWNAKQRHQSEFIQNNHNQVLSNQYNLSASSRKNKYLQSNLNHSGTEQYFEHERFGSVKSMKSNQILSQSPQYLYQSPQTGQNYEEPIVMDDSNSRLSCQQFQGQQQQQQSDSRCYQQQKEIDAFSDSNNYQNKDYYQFNHKDNEIISNNTSNVSRQQQEYQNQELLNMQNEKNLLKDHCVEDNYANNNQDEVEQIVKQLQPQSINEKCEELNNIEDNYYQQQQQIFESEKAYSQKQNSNQQQYQNEVFANLQHCENTTKDQNNPITELKEMSIKSILNLPNTLKQLKAEREPKKLLKNQTTLFVQVAGIILLLSFLYVLLVR